MIDDLYKTSSSTQPYAIAPPSSEDGAGLMVASTSPQPSLTSGYDFPREGRNFASNTRAYLNRSIYDDYKDRFLPHEKELLAQVTGTELLNERLAGIKVNEAHAFTASKGSENRARERYGVENTSRENKSFNLDRNLSRSSAIAASENLTRQHVQDRNMAIISGGASPRTAIKGI